MTATPCARSPRATPASRVALLVRWVHVLSAITWVGGMLFIALVLVPVTRGLGDPGLRTRLVQAAGRRFRARRW